MKIITTFAMSRKWDIVIKNKQLNNLMFSSFITHGDYDINFHDLSERLKFLNCNKINIFNIHPICDKSTKRKLYNYNDQLEISRKNPKYIFYDLSMDTFFNKNIHFKEIFKTDSELLNNSIFIFNEIPWPIIVASFYMKDILISSGSTNRRSVLSPVHYRLAQFITCLEGMESMNNIYESFHKFTSLVSQSYFNFTLEQYSLAQTITFFEKLDRYLYLKYEGYNLNESFIKKDKPFIFPEFIDQNTNKWNIPKFILFILMLEKTENEQNNKNNNN
uniref:DNA-dependent RNA polymerase n=1 Tax=Clavaria fumosa TaxID=264083 RepID=A0A7T3PCV1_9AGAR|nr:DNA-dependent RNA polymerase [Clavaria fumosa]QPZ51158.1 DNA-dependent RNA polymerase [Clavaria fumosa]